MPLDYFLNNKIHLYNKGLDDNTINKWSLWKFQMNIDKFNKSGKKSSSDSINMDQINNLYKKST
jgi:hypothetical protein